MIRYLDIGNGARHILNLADRWYPDFTLYMSGQAPLDVHWREISKDYARRGFFVYPYGASVDDVRYGMCLHFNPIMVALSRIYKSLHVPKAYVDSYRTHMRRQWEPLSGYDLAVLNHRAKGRFFAHHELAFDGESIDVFQI
jgi:hypothetical protein